MIAGGEAAPKLLPGWQIFHSECADLVTEECARLSRAGHGGYGQIGKRNMVAKAQFDMLLEAEHAEYEEKAKAKLMRECEEYRKRTEGKPSEDPE